jgi:hypothetical protein
MPFDQNFSLPMGHEQRVDHATATELRTHLGKDVWTRYFKFAFVRNPWDRVASWYYCDFFKQKDKSFDDWLCGGGLEQPDYGINHVAPAVHWLTDEQGALVIDFVAYYENFEADLVSALRLIGIDISNIPHINASKRPDYRHLYTERTKNIVANYFRDDIRLFDYVYK